MLVYIIYIYILKLCIINITIRYITICIYILYKQVVSPARSYNPFILVSSSPSRICLSQSQDAIENFRLTHTQRGTVTNIIVTVTVIVRIQVIMLKSKQQTLQLRLEPVSQKIPDVCQGEAVFQKISSQKQQQATNVEAPKTTAHPGVTGQGRELSFMDVCIFTSFGTSLHLKEKVTKWELGQRFLRPRRKRLHGGVSSLALQPERSVAQN